MYLGTLCVYMQRVIRRGAAIPDRCYIEWKPQVRLTPACSGAPGDGRLASKGCARAPRTMEANLCCSPGVSEECGGLCDAASTTSERWWTKSREPLPLCFTCRHAPLPFEVHVRIPRYASNPNPALSGMSFGHAAQAHEGPAFTLSFVWRVRARVMSTLPPTPFKTLLAPI